MVTQSQLQELLDYDPETGVLTWKVNGKGARKAGNRAGGYRPDGYRSISIGGKRYLEHRVIWLYVTGSFPREHTDHANGDQGDNRFCNLREATHAENMRNRRGHRNSKTGLKGTRALNGKWVSQISRNGRYKHLGTFDTPELAHAAYIAAAQQAHGEFFRPV